MIGLFITGMIFTSAVIVVPNLSYVNLLYVDQQQLRNTALEALKAMFLDPGYPVDWGSQDPFNQEDVQRFGLAYASSDSFYVSDPDKVQRLVTESKEWGYIEYDKMRELLGLEGYGFSLRILPPFNVTFPKKTFDPPNLNFEVSVTLLDGRPLANAMVNMMIVYSTKSAQEDLYVEHAQNKKTGSLGTCEVAETLDAQKNDIQDVVAIFKVTMADVATVVAIYATTPQEEIVDIHMLGDTISLWIPGDLPPEEQPEESDWVENLVTYNGDNFELIFKGSDKITYGQGYKLWSKTFKGLKQKEPELLILKLWAVPKGEGKRGRRHVVIVGPNPNWMGSRVLQYGSKPQGVTVKVQRNVIISGMTYIAEMILWKESL